MLQGYLERLREEVTEEDYREILMITLQDIEFNRTGFNKTTNDEEFIKILNISKGVNLNVKEK